MENSEKYQLVERLFKQIRPIDEAIWSDQINGYRHKVIATFQRQKNKIVAGQYQPKSHVVSQQATDLMIEHPKSRPIINGLIKLIGEFKYDIFNEKTGYGLFRHVMLRFSYAFDEIMVVLVVNDLRFVGKKNFVKALVKRFPQITTVILNENRRKTSVVLGEKYETIYGPGFIFDQLNDIKFKLSPASFYQVNPEMTLKLYNKAIELANLTKNDTVIDAYCGIGTIGLLAAPSCRHVTGIEANEAAIRDARNNAHYNRVNNIQFIHDDATQRLLLMAANKELADVVFLDPPRSGSTKEFCEAVVKLNPKRIVYVSCEPKTCVRDLKHFEKHYKTEYLILVDQFPLTEHVESVVLMTKSTT